jgi:hypothetical protein
MPEAAPRTSDDLRAELAQLELDLAQLGGRRSSADAKIAMAALLAWRKDPKALKLVAEADAAKRSIEVEASHFAAAREALQAELREAVAMEEAAARQAASDEALAFAAAVGPIGAAVDEALEKFRSSYLELKRRLHDAQRRGYGPGVAMVQTSLTQALRAALWRVTELGIESPHIGLGRSFDYLTTSWAEAARGRALHLLTPPAKANGGPNGSGGAP